jgi:hypothetical protein
MSSLSVTVERSATPVHRQTKTLRPIDHEHSRRGVIHCDLAVRLLDRFGLQKKIEFKDLDAWLIEEGRLASNAQPEKRYYVRRRLKCQVETSSRSARMAERGKPAYRIVCEYNGWRLEAMPENVKRNTHLEKILSQAETSQRQAQLDVEAIDPVQN